MPRRQPFTQLCQQAARLARPVAADLHVHTTASDGDCTPSQVAALARAAGLSAVAVTDHDTTAGLEEAAAAARNVRIVPGVEITTEHAGREYHVLGYFMRPCDARLAAALEQVQAARRTRFWRIIDGLIDQRITFPAGLVEGVEAASASLGRRHVAKLLVAVGAAASTAEAFRRYLGRSAPDVGHRLPIETALRLAADAGGIASLAHPPAGLTHDDLAAFQRLGLHAVEVHFPAATSTRARELRTWTGILGLRVTGGSDYHGNGPAGRSLGISGLSAADFAELCESAGCPA